MQGTDGIEWDAFCDSLDFAQLVPPSLARYRPAVLAALDHFLTHIRPERTYDILAAQAELPEGTDIGARLVAIAHHCPALHKLGQVMARDRRLPPELRRLLQRLETVPCRVEPARLTAAIEAELGPLRKLGVTIDGPPLAEASVAVVVPYLWRERPAASPVRGVFKLLKPGIEQTLEEELELLQAIGALLDERCHHLDLPEIAYAETFAQVRALLAREVHLHEEQAHLAMAARLYDKTPGVVVPALHPFCGPRITAMARIDGCKVTDVEALPADARCRLASLVIEALIARPIWSHGSQSAFHADPHAGNLMATDDGRLAILDWSLVGALSKDEQVQMTQILLGAFAIDGPRIANAAVSLSGGTIDRNALRGVVDRALARIAAGVLPGLDWLTQLMDGVVVEAHGRFSPNLVIFRKVLQTLDGVVHDIAADCRADEVLAANFLKRFGGEWMDRWLAAPFCRDFATHISNADLAQFFLSAPLGLTRLWIDRQQAWLAGCSVVRR